MAELFAGKEWQTFLQILPTIPFETWETVWSTVVATLLALVIGLPLGVCLVTGEQGGVRPLPRWLMALLNGLVNLLLGAFGMTPVDFIDGPYWAKMFVLCFYTVWIVMPFKILILTSALASVNQTYYNAARVDGTSKWRIFTKITLPMISPSIFYLVVTGFIGAFKAYSDAVALFGVNLNSAQMNTIVGYVYDMLYGNSGGYPSYASAAAIVLFSIVLTITCINLLVSKKHVHYV